MYVDMHVNTIICMHHSGENKGQKFVSRFYRIFCRLLIAVPLKMYSKFDNKKWILIGQMLKLVRKWPTDIFGTDHTYNVYRIYLIKHHSIY